MAPTSPSKVVTGKPPKTAKTGLEQIPMLRRNTYIKKETRKIPRLGQCRNLRCGQGEAVIRKRFPPSG